jgi:hypothetical protein
MDTLEKGTDFEEGLDMFFKKCEHPSAEKIQTIPIETLVFKLNHW